MGDPRKPRPKFQTPSHPWNKTRIEEEKSLLREYGLKNKKEIYKMNSLVSNFANQAKRLTVLKSKQAELERKQLMQRLQKLGLLSENAGLEEVLDLKVKDIMERRLQTVVVRKKLARSIKQARQFITHEHILINGTKMTVPSYIVSMAEEESIAFSPKSTLADDLHPERKIEEKEVVPEGEETEEKKPKKETRRPVRQKRSGFKKGDRK